MNPETQRLAVDFDAVIFDVDGTLVNTETLWDEVRRSLAASQGVSWPAEATVAMMGMNTEEWSAYLVEVVGIAGTPAEAAQATIEGMLQHYRQGVPVLQGAVSALRRMARLVPIAIASSSPRVLIEAAAEMLQLNDLVQVIVSTGEVPRGKPAPDGYLRAAELLGVDPTRCVAVEDATSGIQSALAAGMRVVAVPQEFHRPPAELLAKTTVLESLDELTAELFASCSRVSG